MNTPMKKAALLALALMLCAAPALAQGSYRFAACLPQSCQRQTCAPFCGHNQSGVGSTCAQQGNQQGQTGKPSGSSMSAMAQELVRQTNSDRAKNGLGALAVDAELTRVARIRAEEIVEKFSHTRPDGGKVYALSSKVKGENIAKGQQTVDKVMAAWMSSEGHRANILRPSYRSIGVCAYKVGNIMYWVQVFGN